MGDAKARTGRSRGTAAWLCKFCKKPNGDALVNRATNKQCHMCKKLKGQCFSANFDSSNSSSPTTLSLIHI